jgi:anthranilate/para-aminobenzoate synthase component II
MSTNNKAFTKLIGKIFCIIAICLTIVLIAVKMYTGGQIKTVNNVYTAVTHKLYDDYRKCFADGSEYLSEKQFDELCESYESTWGEDYHLSAEFVSREKTAGGVKVNVKLTVYNESEHETSDESFLLVRQGGKWLINE